MARVNSIKRHQFADYLDVSDTGTPEWALCGTGFTTLDEEPGAQSESVKYVNDKAASSSVESYETTFPFESELIPDERAILAIYKVGRDHLLGSDAQFDYLRVELWDPVPGQDNTFRARKFLVSANVDSISGENKIAVSGNLNAVGDPVDGTFNTVDKVFTPTDGSQGAADPGREAVVGQGVVGKAIL